MLWQKPLRKLRPKTFLAGSSIVAMSFHSTENRCNFCNIKS
jgi:hypothetical protein